MISPSTRVVSLRTLLDEAGLLVRIGAGSVDGIGNCLWDLEQLMTETTPKARDPIGDFYGTIFRWGQVCGGKRYGRGEVTDCPENRFEGEFKIEVRLNGRGGLEIVSST